VWAFDSAVPRLAIWIAANFPARHAMLALPTWIVGAIGADTCISAAQAISLPKLNLKKSVSGFSG
jgi:hypothetical protein